MELANEKDREGFVRKLRDFAQILEGEYQPGIVERRGDDLKNDLAAIYAECNDQDLADFLKSAAWTVGCLTAHGRVKIVEVAIEAAAKLNEDLEPKISWQEVARLPLLDRKFFDRAARQLRHLADLLTETDDPPRGHKPTGVKLLDLALILCDHDAQAAHETKERWRKLRDPALPPAIGTGKQGANLYEPAAIVKWAEEIETFDKSVVLQHLTRIARPPSQG